jgi:hypothetical protein
VTGDGADGHGMPFAQTNAFVENGHVLVSPIGVVTFHDHHVGGFDARLGAARKAHFK